MNFIAPLFPAKTAAFQGIMLGMLPSWYSKGITEVYEALRTDLRGLTEGEAAQRRIEAGPNSIPEAPAESVLAIFVRQFKSPLIYVLIGAAGVIYVLGETRDALVIAVVLIFNAIAGALQEGRAANTLRALRTFTTTNATVVRDGNEVIIPDSEIVPGDIVVVREGEKVPADARIIRAQSLATDESALTGESQPVEKTDAPILTPNLTLAEQKNMLFKGTTVVAGNAHAVIVATGIHTEMGRIASEIAASTTEIPLQRDIRRFSHLIIAVVAVLSVALYFVGVMQGLPSREMFATVVTLAVSVIPEGLPIVMTLILATGVWRMSKRNALVKRLQAVEALGHARVIATDKTGTITRNEMVIQKAYVGGNVLTISGSGYEPHGSVFEDGGIVAVNDRAELIHTGRIAALTGTARVFFADAEHRWKVSGDPTEAALIVFAQKLGFKRDEMVHEHPLIAEIPFSSANKYHAVVTGAAPPHLSVVGAPEVILQRATHILKGDAAHTLTAHEKEALEEIIVSFSQEGLRVLALAEKRDIGRTLTPEHVGGLTLVALVGMKDGMRAEVPSAMRDAHAAGIRVVMITGDHKITARAIATEAGIFKPGDRVLTGEDIDAMSDESLARELARTAVFARVTPEHKLRIITAYRARGEGIAMTGDGVNDAPSLVAADLGVAMGVTGTEVAKEAADIILLDDNFATILAAVEEGRSIYSTLRKGILYFFSTSVGEVLVIAGALFAMMPLPLLPAQIIWLNFVTDGFLTVALAMEPKERGLLSRPFAKPTRYLVDSAMTLRVFVMAIPMGVGTLLLFALYLDQGLAMALTVSMTVLAVFQWFNAWNCRSHIQSIVTSNPFANTYLIGATILVVALQLVAVYNPFFASYLHTVPLTLVDWLIIIPVASTVVLTEELRKFFARRS